MKVRTSDGFVVECSERLIKDSGLLSDLLYLSQQNEDDIVPLTHVDAATLRGIMDWYVHPNFRDATDDELQRIINGALYMSLGQLQAACKTEFAKRVEEFYALEDKKRLRALLDADVKNPESTIP